VLVLIIVVVVLFGHAPHPGPPFTGTLVGEEKAPPFVSVVADPPPLGKVKTGTVGTAEKA
jgi:hypothetical protein